MICRTKCGTSEELLSVRARTMEHLTIVASRTFTQAKPSAGSFPTCGGPGGYPASTEIIRPHCTNPQLRRQPNYYVHCQLGEGGGALSRHECRAQNRLFWTARKNHSKAHISTASVSTSALPAIVPLSIRHAQQTTVPAWIRAQTGGLTLAGWELRQQAPSGPQHEENQAPAAGTRCLAEIPPALERARRTTPPSRMSARTRVPGVAPGGVQQPPSR